MVPHQRELVVGRLHLLDVLVLQRGVVLPLVVGNLQTPGQRILRSREQQQRLAQSEFCNTKVVQSRGNSFWSLLLADLLQSRNNRGKRLGRVSLDQVCEL